MIWLCWPAVLWPAVFPLYAVHGSGLMAASCNKSVLDVKPVFRLINPMAWCPAVGFESYWTYWPSRGEGYLKIYGLSQGQRMVFVRYSAHIHAGGRSCSSSLFLIFGRAMYPVPCSTNTQDWRRSYIDIFQGHWCYFIFIRLLRVPLYHLVSPRAHTIRRPSHVVS